MVIPSHSTIISDKMKQLANVTTQAATRITEQILSGSASLLRDAIGSDEYDAYLDSLELLMVIKETTDDPPVEYLEYDVFDAKTFGDLSVDQKSLRNLIYAEAYFGLYNLSIALRKLVKGNVNVSREASGSTSVNAAGFDEIVGNMELYREQAYICISSALGNDEDADIYVDGTVGVFVV